QPALRTSWLAYVLMLGGALMVEWMVWSGRADVLFTSYVPLRADPLLYVGVVLFAVRALVSVGSFFAWLVTARREGRHAGSRPLVVCGAGTAASIAVSALAHGAAIDMRTDLGSLGVMPVDPQVYRRVWWGLGHPSQQINVAAMVASWYML